MNSDTPKKSLGQHWLHDRQVLADIAAAAAITVDDVVLEIGPGLGTLTEVLVGQAREVIAVEFDSALAADLPKRVNSRKLQVIEHDILRFDFGRLPPGYKLVANIPYYLTSNLLRLLSETINPPSIAVLLVQREVAERVAAKPGAMSILSVTAQYYWAVELGSLVPARLFTPPPKVDSQVLILTRRARPLFMSVDTKQFFLLVKAGFSQRRKTLLNTLSGGLRLEKAAARELCIQAGIDPGRRAQSLRLDEWHALYQALPPS